MEQIIKKAIEGGYSSSKNCGLNASEYMCMKDGTLRWQVYCYDALFWQALGKSLGWAKYTWTSWKGWDDHWITYPTDEEKYSPPTENAYAQRHPTFLYHWHRFIDWTAEGKSHEDFFTALLINNNQENEI